MKPLLFLTQNAKEYLNSIRKEKTIKFGIWTWSFPKTATRS